MGRYVVIDFDENEDADQVVKDMANGLMPRARVVGIFVKPRRFCKCWDARHINYGDKNRQESIVLGERFGWWICTRCKRPRRAGHQLVNQIKASETPEGPSEDGYEMTVTGLQVTGIHRKNIKRKKKLKNKEMRK